MLWVLSDVRYVAALNSFSTDTAAFVGLFIAVPALVMSIRNDSAIASLLLIVGGGLLAASKTQHAPIGILVSAALLVTGVARRRWHSVVAGLALATVSFVVFRLTPTDYNARPLFNAVGPAGSGIRCAGTRTPPRGVALCRDECIHAR
jgi:hypothetical protein